MVDAGGTSSFLQTPTRGLQSPNQESALLSATKTSNTKTHKRLKTACSVDNLGKLTAKIKNVKNKNKRVADPITALEYSLLDL